MKIRLAQGLVIAVLLLAAPLVGVQTKISDEGGFVPDGEELLVVPQTAVTIQGRQIYVNGQPFLVRGVGYSAVPIGIDPETTPPYGDYFTIDHSPAYMRDFELLRAMGANTLRLWGWNNVADHSHFLSEAYNNGFLPFYVIVTFWMGPSAYPDITSPAARTQIKTAFRNMVASHKDNPAVLMWAIGNELNAPWMYGDRLNDLFSLVEEMALEAHAEEGVNYHPVTLPLADINLIQTIAAYESSVPHLDVWSAQIYRGDTFGALFTEYEAASIKPLVITEFGIDAYDDEAGAEYEPNQAIYARDLWTEIEAHSPVCAGGTIMAFRDEWWKGKYGQTDASHPDCPESNPNLHSPCGYSSTSHPDGYANEEFWGIFRAFDNGSLPDRLEPRMVYQELRALWTNLAFLPLIVR